MTDDTLWQTKLAARIHDPAEKALVLLRDPAGHEGGSIVGIGKELGFRTRTIRRRDGGEIEKLELPPEMESIIKQADRWAAAADRAQFPKDQTDRFQSWAQVRFADHGELIHPLSGESYRVDHIGQTVFAEHIKKVSEEFFKNLVQKDRIGKIDLRRTALAFWRFGPELGRELEGIGPLWNLLPADTRTPDHTIWQHLDLCSALAGAMVDGSTPALLTVSIGPVQDFIAAGRSTSDLWAGSHFLSTLTWQAMKIVVERFGPDAMLFPQIRGVPIVDLWLIEQGLDHNLFSKADWNDTNTDYNPLFVAALPNKFVAIVPESAGRSLGEAITQEIRNWVRQQARAMLDRVLVEISETPNGQPCYRQLDAQLQGFPEVHWSLAPWLDQNDLKQALAPFYPTNGKEPGLFGTTVWDILATPIEPRQQWRFWEPNEGIVYPAVHELGDRMLTAAKCIRPFGPLPQQGYRDSMTGEHEWLTLDERQLIQGSPRQRTDTLWARVAERRPSWVKKGEHLSAFGLIKRLWPTQYVAWLREQGIDAHLDRYIVSTHVMALAPTLEHLIQRGPAHEREPDEDKCQEAQTTFEDLKRSIEGLERPALPRRLMRGDYRSQPSWELATKLPTLVDKIRQQAEEGEEAGVVDVLLRKIEQAAGIAPERYYGLILMDGDRLGAWLSGENTLLFAQSFHSQVRNHLQNMGDATLGQFLQSRRPASPARHMAISSALNGFALDLVRHVVEDLCLGKVLYAGGDDVMAMVSAGDLLRAAGLLRAVYSGSWPEDVALVATDPSDLELKKGFVRSKNRLYMVMGKRATASCGAIIAHHQTPLTLVLRELRAAERRAKTEGDRDAFSLTVLKRSGGALVLTSKWGEPITLLDDLRQFLADPGVSRRAVYHSVEWLTDLPEPTDDGAMLASLLAYQLTRQAENSVQDRHDIRGLARRLAEQTVKVQTQDRRAWLRNFLTVAEFLAREVRAGGNT